MRNVENKALFEVVADYTYALDTLDNYDYERLTMKLSAMEDEKISSQAQTIWMNHNTLERGNPVKIFKGDL